MTFNFNVGGITPSDSQGGGGGTTIIETLAPKNSAGLCFWLDGQCNTRNGKDHTKTYLENLVWNKPQTATFGLNEYLNNGTDNSWNGDFLKLGNYAQYPYCYYPQMTIEAVVKLTNVNNTSYPLIWGNWISNGGGVMIWADACSAFAIQVMLSGSSAEQINTYDKLDLEAGKIYYLVFKYHSGYEMSIEVVNENLKVSTAIGNIAFPTTTMQPAIGSYGNTSPAANGSNWEDLEIGMLRMWNRLLTDAEIQKNYQDVKKRFNF